MSSCLPAGAPRRGLILVPRGPGTYAAQGGHLALRWSAGLETGGRGYVSLCLNDGSSKSGHQSHPLAALCSDFKGCSLLSLCRQSLSHPPPQASPAGSPPVHTPNIAVVTALMHPRSSGPDSPPRTPTTTDTVCLGTSASVSREPGFS